MHPRTPTTGGGRGGVATKTPERSDIARFASRRAARSRSRLTALSWRRRCHTLDSAFSRIAHVLTRMASASGSASVRS